MFKKMCVMVALLLLTALLCLMWGSSGFGWPSDLILYEVRLPRVLSAIVAGALLAWTGTVLQVLLKNPLADPYIMGVAGGASFGALLGLMLGGSLLWALPLSAMGALLSLLCVLYFISRFVRASSSDLILIGALMAAGWGAAVQLLFAMADPTRIPAMTFWLLGDIPYRYPHLGLWLGLLFVVMFSVPFAARLNVLSLHEHKVQSLGLDISLWRFILLGLTGVLITLVVVHSGPIGFVGLVVPHLMRLWWQASYSYILPGSLLGGATLMLLAELISRTVIAPKQLPVGVVTAIVGIPLFFFLLKQRLQRDEYNG